MKQYDLIVLGGGLAGVAASVSAAWRYQIIQTMLRENAAFIGV
jgi:succinate dehydrogenase/fumarate reductase flavoprotein subunit